MPEIKTFGIFILRNIHELLKKRKAVLCSDIIQAFQTFFALIGFLSFHSYFGAPQQHALHVCYAFVLSHSWNPSTRILAEHSYMNLRRLNGLLKWLPSSTILTEPFSVTNYSTIVSQKAASTYWFPIIDSSTIITW